MQQTIETNLKQNLNKFKAKTYLQISSSSSLKTEYLNDFLTLKLNENNDKINMMLIPEFRFIYQNYFKIYTNDELRNDNLIRLGSTSCDLETLSIDMINNSVSICPWHWLIDTREDRYPFKRPLAKCNCNNCQAKTIYDSEIQRLSSCKAVNSIMPVLIRSSVVNDTEKWFFNLEEVPTSCVCSIKLKPQF